MASMKTMLISVFDVGTTMKTRIGGDGTPFKKQLVSAFISR